MKKTSDKHFRLFKHECEKWVNRFELHEWTVSYEWKPLQGADAEYNASYQGRCVVIALSKEIEPFEKTMEDEIREVAFHEICELMLYPLRSQIVWRNFDAGEMESATHAVIHRLYRLLGDK